MNSVQFVGRGYELEKLDRLLDKKTASLVVIKGRRRIGKSRLVEEFAKSKTFYTFTGLSPVDGIDAQSQRDEFARQLSEQFDLSSTLKTDDWGTLFTLLAKYTEKGRVIILLDEISWMGDKDPEFLPKLKNAWDNHFKKNPKLMLILCGSISSWIEKNIISSTGYFGRITEKITLEELSLFECSELLKEVGFKGSALEKLMILSITGGIPWYIELINHTLSASENIKRLCFEKDGILVNEFNHIFHDLFGKRNAIYKSIVRYLAEGAAEYSDISDELNYSSSGVLTEYLDDLIMSGYINRDFSWNLNTGKESTLSHYRLKDNYLRFYLKYIAPVLSKIEKNQMKEVAVSALPGFDTLMGLQFENVVLNNRALIFKKLGIRTEDIVCDNPFYQRKTTKQAGCQIDYMIQTKFNTLYVCEIKFTRKIIESKVTREVEEKIKRMKKPKNFACVPVLIHTGDVSEKIIESNYFANVINFEKIMEDKNA
ncbi:MAG: ATP-binding protein [Gammaproteobacteria bacterium]